ncbi:hypothetical protein V6N13_116258 [Hibiscus sabdariffa]
MGWSGSGASGGLLAVPQEGWFTLNIDGSRVASTVGVCPILETELLGVAEGLHLAWAAGVRATVLEVLFDTPDEVVSLVHADVSLTMGGG